jgi:hypothetical protein
MENLNFGDPIDLWESWDDHGKLHIGYDVCVDCLFFLSMGPRDWRSASLYHWGLYSFCTKNAHFLT